MFEIDIWRKHEMMAPVINGSYKKVYEKFFVEALNESDQGSYDDCALPSYAHGNKLIRWIFWKRIIAALSMAGNLENKTVLDFGCGSGVMFKYLNDYGCVIHACDSQYYELAVDLAKKMNINISMYQNLSEIENKKFDLIFALDVLEHIENIRQIIDKLYELSHNETVVILSGPTENYLYRVGRRIAGFSGLYHKRNIYDVEKQVEEKGYINRSMKKLFPIVTLFRVSSWSKSV